MSEASEEGHNPFHSFAKESLKAGTKAEGREAGTKADEREGPDPSLEEGACLPYHLRKIFPPGLTNNPIADVDPFYKKTFVVVNSRRDIFRFSAENALWFLHPLSAIRRGAVCLAVHPLFACLTLLTVLINAFFMAIPATPSMEAAQVIFVAIYTFEVAVKVVARGFIFHPFTYLRDAWNWLDFVVTVLSYASIFVGGLDVPFSSLRMLRLMKFDGIFPGLRILVRSVFKSLQSLGEALVFIAISLIIAAILGLQQYMGILTQKCVRNLPEDGSFGNATNENWELFVSNYTNWYGDMYETVTCGNVTGSRQCPTGYTCLQGYGSNPNYGYTNFDTFGWSYLSAFRLMTQDYWENLYHLVLSTAGPGTILFFIFILFLVSFNFLNLILAIVTTSFNELKKKEEEEEKVEKSVKGNGQSCQSRDTTVDIQDITEEGDDKPQVLPANNDDRSVWTKIVDLLCIWNCCKCWVVLRQFVASIVLNPFAELFFLFNIVLNTIFMALDHHNMGISLERTLRSGNYLCTSIFIIEVLLKIIALSPKYYLQKRLNVADFVIVLLCAFEIVLEGVWGLSIFRMFRVVKLLQLTRSAWPVLNYLICVMGKSLGLLSKLAFLVVITTFALGLIGMHWFGLCYIENVDRFIEEELPRWNFIDMMHSFMVVFRALCGEWIESMWDCLLVGDISCIPFFIATVVVGGFVLRNLFLSVILHGFASCDPLAAIEDEDVLKILEAFEKIGLKKNKKKPNAADNSDNGEETNENKKEDQNVDSASRWSSFRETTNRLIENKYFEIAIIIIIVLSSLALTLEDVFLPYRPLLQSVLHHLDAVFTMIFVIEMLIMWLGLGFKKYFKNAWYWLDFVVVVTSSIHLIASISGFGTLQVFKIMRILRLFRLLRLLSKCQALKILLDTLVKAAPLILGGLLLTLLIWLVFAVMGVQLFAGKFFKCVDDNGTIFSHEIIPDLGACIDNNYTWENSPINFDHIGNAYLSLLQVATFKGWIMIMNDAVDSREIDVQPIREVNIYMYCYFIVFVLFGAFLTVNLFVGIIVKTYCQQRRVYLKQTSSKHYNATNRIDSKKPTKIIPKPDWKPQSALYDFVTNKQFEVVMVVIIAVSLLPMMFDHYMLRENFAIILDYTNFVFIVIFTAECLLKMAALRHHYFRYSWNWFDFTLTLQQIFQLVASDFFYEYLYSVPLPLLRVARIVKIRKNLRPVKWLKGVRVLFFTLANSFLSLMSVGVLLFLVVFVYAVFGVHLFKHVEEKSGLDDLYNFKTFGQSVVTLFPLTTWAGWDGVFDAITNEDNCVLPNEETGEAGNCGSWVIGTLYLLSYIFVTFLITSTYVAVILTNYSEAIEDEEEGLTDDDVDMFYEVWQNFDPNATEYIRSDQLADLLEALEPPFRSNKYNQSRIDGLEIPSNKDNLIFYKDVLKALAADVCCSGEHPDAI